MWIKILFGLLAISLFPDTVLSQPQGKPDLPVSRYSTLTTSRLTRFTCFQIQYSHNLKVNQIYLFPDTVLSQPQGKPDLPVSRYSTTTNLRKHN